MKLEISFETEEEQENFSKDLQRLGIDSKEEVESVLAKELVRILLSPAIRRVFRLSKRDEATV